MSKHQKNTTISPRDLHMIKEHAMDIFKTHSNVGLDHNEFVGYCYVKAVDTVLSSRGIKLDLQFEHLKTTLDSVGDSD